MFSRFRLVDADEAEDEAAQDGQLEAVRVVDLEGGTRSLEADRLLPFFGLSMALGPLAEWGITLERQHIPVDPASLATSIPGCFAVG
ncbi:MAG TPA: hypothetical protein VKT70_04495, partial [Stellaceae bacterium]|nr:hypothetical protein [Stellaceae bacterium]